MTPTPDEITQSVAREAGHCLDECMTKIRHCLGQLSPQQVWWRPQESLNSIGNLLLHLTGNVRQWLISGLGGVPDVRDRPREFSQRTSIPKEDLIAQLQQTVNEAKSVLSELTAADVLRERRVQGSEWSGIGVIFDSLPHFKGHTQEIVCYTRLQLGDEYQFHWQPRTPEEGAPG